MSESTALAVIDPKTQQDVQALVAVIHQGAIVIRNQDEYSAAGIRLVAIKGNQKKLKAFHDELVQDLKSALTKWDGFFAPPKLRLAEAELAEKTAMNAYLVAEEAKRAAAQKLLDEAAAKERARIQALADAAAAKAAAEIAAARQREANLKAAAAQAAAEAQRKQNTLIAKGKAEAAAAAKEKSDLQAKLAAAEAEKESAKAAKIESSASVRADLASAKIASLVAPAVKHTAPVAAGVGTRKVWVYDILDENDVSRAYMTVDDKKVTQAIAVGVRDIPGLHIHQKTIMTSRS